MKTELFKEKIHEQIKALEAERPAILKMSDSLCGEAWTDLHVVDFSIELLRKVLITFDEVFINENN